MQLAAGTKLFPFLFFYTEELGANGTKKFFVVNLLRQGKLEVNLQ